MKINELWSRKTIDVKIGSVYKINRFDDINHLYNLNYPKDNHTNPELQFSINGIVLGYSIKNMDNYDHYYLIMKTDDGNIVNVHNTNTDLLKDITYKMIREVKSHYLSFNDKIGVPRSCEPYMYNTRDNLSEVNIGDTLEISFQSGYGVHKNYKGRTIKFLVNNFYEYNYYQSSKLRRIAIVPLDKKDKFEFSEIIFLDSTERFKDLMIDLFPINRKPFRGWQNKTIKIKNHLIKV